MDKVGGPLGVTAIAVVAALVVCLAILHFGFHAFRRRKGKSRAKPHAPQQQQESKSPILSDSRVEVLETTIIDAERRLVLIRCDRIEHLIMIGGPADVVVENDVRKVRGPGAPPAKIPGFEMEKRAPAVQRPATPTPPPLETAIAPAPKPVEPHRAAPRAEARPTPAGPRGLPTSSPARPGPRAADGNGAPQSARADDSAHRAPAQRPQPADSAFGRRDASGSQRRAPQTQHPPAVAGRSTEPIRAQPTAQANDRNVRTARAGGRAEPATGLPAAQIPWSDPDSIENEIVRALRFDPQTRGGDQAPNRREAPSAKAMMDSHTTLGDLADRLEEALAREVQSASQPHNAPEIDEFGFDSEPGSVASEPPKPAAPPKDRPEKREPQRTAMAAAPEAEPRRGETPSPAERREEAPVISLNSRRRESADQLEDEMARLLGELTSDNKGR